MAEIVDFQTLKRRKDAEKIIDKMVNGSMLESLNEYISIMKLVVQNHSIKMDKLFIECIGEDVAIFRDKEGKIINYKTLYDSVEEYVENHDLLMTGIITLSPKEIIIRNSGKLNEHLLYVIKEIFEGRVFIES